MSHAPKASPLPPVPKPEPIIPLRAALLIGILVLFFHLTAAALFKVQPPKPAAPTETGHLTVIVTGNANGILPENEDFLYDDPRAFIHGDDDIGFGFFRKDAKTPRVGSLPFQKSPLLVSAIPNRPGQTPFRFEFGGFLLDTTLLDPMLLPGPQRTVTRKETVYPFCVNNLDETLDGLLFEERDLRAHANEPPRRPTRLRIIPPQIEDGPMEVLISESCGIAALDFLAQTKLTRLLLTRELPPDTDLRIFWGPLPQLPPSAGVSASPESHDKGGTAL